MRESILTEQQIKKYGSTVYASDDNGWRSEPYRAIIQPLRYKNKMYLENTRTEIGVSDEGRYLYIGPPSHDLTQLEGNSYLHFDGGRCLIERSEKVRFKDDTVYIWAVLKTSVELP